MKKIVLLSASVLALTLFSFKATEKSGVGAVVLTDGGIYQINKDVLSTPDKRALLSLQGSIDQPLGWYIVSCSGTVDTKGCIAGSGCADAMCNYDILDASVKAQVDGIMQKYLQQ